MARRSQFPGYNNLRQMTGRNGKTFIVFRHALIGQKTLPGFPGDQAFEAEYEALRLLVDVPPDAPAAPPKLPTFADAFTAWKDSDEWGAYTDKTRTDHTRFVKWFLDAPVDPKSTVTFKNVEITTPEVEILPLLRDYISGLASPHNGKRSVIAIRKLYAAAITGLGKCKALRNLGNDLEQPELPKATPQRKWPDDICEKFERRHQLGSAARTCYALARYGCGRRGDVARIAWDQLRTKRYIDENDEIQVATMIVFDTQKNAKNGNNASITVVVRPELEIVLNALDRSKGGTVLKNAYGDAFSEKSLTNQMAVWCTQAGIGEGFTLHGLRRTFASEIAEGALNGEADLFAIQKSLGHKHISTTQIYLDALDADPMAFRAAAAGTRRANQVKRLRAIEK